jgi:transcriptional regulator with XRE-family HTH domain
MCTETFWTVSACGSYSFPVQPVTLSRFIVNVSIGAGPMASSSPPALTTRIREIRKRRRLTLQALADRVGTTAQTIQRLETDNMMVSIDWLRRIGDALRLAPGELVTADRVATLVCIGEANAEGTVKQTSPAEQRLPISLPDLEPIAVQLSAAIGPFGAGSLLVGARIDHARSIDSAGRDCIVATVDGRVLVRHVTRTRAGKLVLRQPGGTGTPEPGGEIDWIAPVSLALRVFP